MSTPRATPAQGHTPHGRRKWVACPRGSARPLPCDKVRGTAGTLSQGLLAHLLSGKPDPELTQPRVGLQSHRETCRRAQPEATGPSGGGNTAEDREAWVPHLLGPQGARGRVGQAPGLFREGP